LDGKRKKGEGNGNKKRFRQGVRNLNKKEGGGRRGVIFTSIHRGLSRLTGARIWKKGKKRECSSQETDARGDETYQKVKNRLTSRTGRKKKKGTTQKNSS